MSSVQFGEFDEAGGSADSLLPKLEAIRLDHDALGGLDAIEILLLCLLCLSFLRCFCIPICAKQKQKKTA